MTWDLVIAFIIGLLCAVRLPILIFTLVVLVVIVVLTVTAIVLGNSLFEALTWAFLVAAALEAGCVAMNGIFYLLYVRRHVNERKQSPLEVNSKFSGTRELTASRPSAFMRRLIARLL
ncbi:membrane protein implicated in regulation of membrane protease activity [Neorhizobium galegae]|uniref:hypothetical protein n=1 Tax=Neorhizobium galegae TaxID=399 RepID=UPI001AE44F60|nr:hypothetical protein [Neorhizobium galegae]MBP2561343.1 membrane protein implicated in regulation of membrane protease activity [Neorhizobium galegae]MDQ0134341.1 membrane protein implicated in regulation of membrane protease activity [Neorhizobium galegae]